MTDTNKPEPVTKADLKELATKADLQELAKTTKADLAAVEIKLSIAIAKTQTDIHNIRETMSTKEDINRIMNHIDAFAAEALSYRNHDTLRGAKIMEHGRLRRIALVTA